RVDGVMAAPEPPADGTEMAWHPHSHFRSGTGRMPPSRMERSRFWAFAIVAAALAAGLFTLLTAPPMP
ncbi:hypothetical protein, partial [Acinetobacter baumannii]|uniref:hypothetical protein n=1 Tax=Acinetobacter baumannii TaxID=470 RepID=UPI001C0A591A